MRLAIFGTGGFGREVLKPAREMLAATDPERSLVFVTDTAEAPVLGVEVVSPETLTPSDRLVVALGSSDARRQVAERLAHVPAGNVFARSCLIGPGVEIGEGAVFCDYTMVTASASIGRHFQCNIYSYVAHDCVIGDFVTFAPRVCCNGNVRVEEGAYVGTGAVIKQGSPGNPIVIGAGATVGMGAVVTKSVPEGATVVGNPARAFGS